MFKPIAIAVVGLCAATATSFAQTSTSPKSASECQQMWQSADANSDGSLNMNEIVNAMSMSNTASTTGSTTGTTGSTTGTTGTTTDTTASTTTGSTTGTSDTTASTSGTTGTTGTSDTTASTSGTTTGTTAGSAAGMMLSQQDFMTACTTGQ